MPTNIPNHIFVGCGGSGAKTAVALAHLMSRDPRWRDEIDNSLFFLFVDTDRRPLAEAKASIEKLEREVFVRTVSTTAGYNAPLEIVEDFKSAIRRKPAREQAAAVKRMSEHWWSDNPDAEDLSAANYFDVPKVKDIEKGAGQVPMVSYVAAWRAMSNNPVNPENTIESAIGALCDRIAANNAIKNSDAASDVCNIIFVGSVAGGTGRGCSIPIAFKMKEMFYRRFQRMPGISGYFFNEDCFGHIAKTEDMRCSMKMNAMTGWSELSGWIEQRNSSVKPYWYGLPSLTDLADPVYDVVNLPREYPDANVPFDSVGIICKRAGTTYAAPDDGTLYDMLASALYVRITESHVDSERVNDGRTYFSVGASTAEVPVQKIEEFFIASARIQAVNNAKREGRSEEVVAATEEILALLGFGHDSVDEFLSSSGGDSLTLMQEVAAALAVENGVIDQRLQRLAEALQSQNVADSQDAALEIVDGAHIADLVQPVAEIYERLLMARMSATQNTEISTRQKLKDAILQSLMGWEGESSLSPISVLAKSRSLKVVSTVAEGVCVAITNSTEAGGRLSADKIDAHSSAAMLPTDLVETLKRREGPLGIMGRHFSEAEIGTILAAAKRQIQKQCLKALGNYVRDGAATENLFGQIVKTFRIAAKNSGSVLKVMDELQTDTEFTNETRRQQREEYFTNTEKMEASLGISDMNSVAHMMSRKIKPLYPEESALHLECSSLNDVLRDMLLTTELEMGSSANNQRLKEAWERCRYYIKKNGNLSSIIEEMTLDQVLRQLEPEWQQYLQKVFNRNRDDYAKIAQKFQDFFGLPPQLVDTTVKLRKGDEFKDYDAAAGDHYLMASMAAVCARTCHPFWTSVKGSGEARRVVVHVPLSIDSNRQKNWSAIIQKNAKIGVAEGVKVLDLDDGGKQQKKRNVYTLIAYTSAGATSLDDISSLAVWREDPTVGRALANAEGRSVMMHALDKSQAWNGYRGAGFTDPVYIRNAELRRARWRPWVPADKRERDKDGGMGMESIMGIVYALKGAEWMVREAIPDRVEEALKKLADGKFNTQPILRLGQEHAVSVDRLRQRYFENDIAEEMLDAPMEGSQVARSLNKLYETIPASLDGKVDGNIVRQAIAEYEVFIKRLVEKHDFSERDKKTLVRAVRELAVSERKKPGTASADFWQGVVSTIDANRGEGNAE